MMMKMVNLLLLMAVFLSCSKSSVEDKSEKRSKSTFELGKIEAVFTESVAQDQSWPDIKNMFTMELETCFLDKYYLNTIAGEKFEIESDLSVQTVRTNANGCIRWNESLEFNYFADETNIEISGTITGEGDHRGVIGYSLAVNPWTGAVVYNSENVYNLSSMRGATKSSSNMINNFNVSEYEMTVLQTRFFKEETYLKIDIATTPSMQRLGLNGTILSENLTQGNFSGKYYLIESNRNNDTKKIIATFEDNSTQLTRDGKIRSMVEFEIREGIDPNADVEIAFEIIPQNTTLLMADTGVLKIESLRGRQSGLVQELAVPLDFIKNLEEAIVAEAEQDVDDFGFILDSIAISSGSPVGLNMGNNPDRRVKAKFDIKMIDSLIKEDIKNHAFQVDVIDSEKGTTLFSNIVSTLHGAGNMKFEITIPFKITDSRGWRRFSVRVTGVNDPFSMDLSKERIVYINPFLEGNDNFGIDSKFGEAPVLDSEYSPEIKVRQLSYFFKGNPEDSFKLNKKLDLMYSKVLTLEMEPKLKVEQSFNSNFASYPRLPNGDYRVRFLILAPKNPIQVDYTREVNLQDYYTLTGNEVSGTVEDGLLRVDVKLPLLFTDQIYYTLKNLALVEISAIDQDANISPGYFVGNMVGSENSATIGDINRTGMSLSSGNINIARTLIDRLETVNHKLQRDESIDWYKNYTDFKALLAQKVEKVQVFNHTSFVTEETNARTFMYDSERDLKRSKSLTNTESEITRLIRNPNEATSSQLEMVCHLIYDKNAIMTQMVTQSGGHYATTYESEIKGYLYDKCIENPLDFFRLKKLMHVSSILEQPSFVTIEPKTFTRSNARFMSKGDILGDISGVREAEFRQRGWAWHLGIEGGKFGMFGGANYGGSGGFRTDVYVMNQTSSIISNQERMINQDGISVHYDRFEVNFAANTKSCLLITPKYVEVNMPKRYEAYYPGRGLAEWMFGKKDNIKRITSNRTYYICTGNVSSETITENWYFLKLADPSQMGDDALMKNTVVNVIRGDDNIEIFREKQINRDQSLILFKEGVPQDQLTQQYTQYLDKQGKNLDHHERVGVGFPSMIQVRYGDGNQ